MPHRASALKSDLPSPRNTIRFDAALIVQGILDWDTARRHDGNNISSYDWNRLPSVLHHALRQSVPDIETDANLFSDFDILVGATRNLNMLHMVANQITAAHLTAHYTGDRRGLDEAAKSLQARIRYAEKYSPDGTRPSSDFHIAQMLAAGDPVLERKRAHVDIRRAQQMKLKIT